MKARTLRRWSAVHTWSSLVCTVFLLLIRVTGLPLVFQHELNELVRHTREPSVETPANARVVSLDELIADSRPRAPVNDIVLCVDFDDDSPSVFISLAPSFAAAREDDKLVHWYKYDLRNAELINTSVQYRKDMSGPAPTLVGNVLAVAARLHIDLFARLPGQLFLGAMGFLFLSAILSGVVLYGPFMKRLAFGTVRRDRSSRLKWLDLHNLLGIATLAWGAVVGLTGVINDVAVPLNRLWLDTDVRQAWAPWEGRTPLSQSGLAPVQTAFDVATQALPGMRICSIGFPRPEDGSAYHYMVWANGSTPQTERLSTVVLVDAKTGALTKVLPMPWYLRVLEMSRPLHFGDYGGLPLKILWALLDLLMIVILASGIVLWLKRRRYSCNGRDVLTATATDEKERS